MDTVKEPSPFDDLEDRILPWSQVKVICGLSRTTVWRMQKTGDFPACVQVSQNRVGWWQSELLAWRRARTPRRLPEPRVMVAAAKPVESPTVGRKMAEPQRALRPERPRQKRKSGVPENQTAFDFGG
ncbi:helix-turn-helix transcriptional regulator [Brevundimonas fontaquae]|jgi:prophage regulatory protein|uniref:AlpA family phage regulatory protein n=1 Tax=Brevundimonas fontaquae TaxID=2813778 RepID=A0ABX7LU00_9CAUL|nr:AlpA family phage regulatory protein [Brevundimonas fontaquae]QSF54861.1 AlpA family phage regulatory protein [Brevundimonas fontaquae]